MSDMVEQVLARTQVMFEDLKRDIGVIAEGHLMLVEKVDAQAVRLDHLEGRLTGFHDETRVRFAALEEHLAAVDQHLVRVDGRLERIEGHLEFRGTRQGRRPPARRTTRPRRPR
jgi:hypothetical protein